MHNMLWLTALLILENCFIQVLSSTVGNALTLTGGTEAEATATFIQLVDKLFDCLNVGNYTEGKKTRNPFKQPYRSVTDFRFRLCALCGQ